MAANINRVVLVGNRVPGVQPGQHHPQREARPDRLGAVEGAGDRDRAAELLAHLADRCLGRALPRLHLPAGQLPAAGRLHRGGTAGRQQAPVRHDGHADHQARGHRPSGARASWRDWATSRPVESHTSASSSRNPPAKCEVEIRTLSQPGAGTART